MSTLEQRVAEVTERGKALLEALRVKVGKLELPKGGVVIPEFETAVFTLEEDKYNGQQTLMASFYPKPRYRAGVVLFHSDGSCYAEYHVMCYHPAKPRYFIESVEAWERNGQIQADLHLNLMPA